MYRNKLAEIDVKSPLESGAVIKPEDMISPRSRFYMIIASLLTLFLGALEALVMSAAMPTIVTDLVGLQPSKGHKMRTNPI